MKSTTWKWQMNGDGDTCVLQLFCHMGMGQDPKIFTGGTGDATATAVGNTSSATPPAVQYWKKYTKNQSSTTGNTQHMEAMLLKDSVRDDMFVFLILVYDV